MSIPVFVRDRDYDIDYELDDDGRIAAWWPMGLLFWHDLTDEEEDEIEFSILEYERSQVYAERAKALRAGAACLGFVALIVGGLISGPAQASWREPDIGWSAGTWALFFLGAFAFVMALWPRRL